MIAFFVLSSLVFYSINAAPMLANPNDQKMNGQASYQTFNLFDLPVISKRPTQKAADVPLVTSHQVKADLAVVASAEADDKDLSPFEGYGEAKPSDMFVIDAPKDAQESKDAEFKPIGVAPKLTGGFISNEPKTFTDKSGSAIINPTAYFLEGADLDKAEKPKCRMIGCDGPVVDDDIVIESLNAEGKNSEKCYQTFVPIVDAQIRVGMSCRICCDSTALLKELKKTRLQLDTSN